MAAALLLIFSSGIFGWGAMGSGQGKGFTSPEVQQIITKKHEAAQNKATCSHTDGFTQKTVNSLKTAFSYVIVFSPPLSLDHQCLSSGHQISKDEAETATFAAGCFWGVQLAFQRVPGVAHSMVGYTSGRVEHPTYQQVCGGGTGHTEAVQLLYNPAVVSFKELLLVLFDRMDPTTLNRQGNDRGTQYRSGVYYHSDQQKVKK